MSKALFDSILKEIDGRIGKKLKSFRPDLTRTTGALPVNQVPSGIPGSRLGAGTVTPTELSFTPYEVGGTDVSLADGGTGASLTDPNADRILFWDDSAGAVAWLAPNTNLSISGTDLNASGGGAGSIDVTDGITTVTSVTDLTFPSGTISSAGAGLAEYTPAGGSGNSTSTGAVGSEPGSPSTGDLYLPDNGFSIERYSGSLWAPWGPMFPLASPPISGWSWDNQSTAAVVTTNGGIALTNYTASGNLNVRYRSLPAAPYTITMGLLIACNFTTGSGTENIAGVCWRDSGGQIITVEFGHYFNNNVFRVRAWNSTTSFNAQSFGTNGLGIIGPVMWVRLKDDNTNRLTQLSADGVNFFTVYSASRTSFMTANGYGLFVRPLGDQSIVTLISLLEGP